MHVVLNDTSIELSNNSSVIALLEAINLLGKNGIAIAINNEVVPKSDWENFRLKDNDKILLITATQGG